MAQPICEPPLTALLIGGYETDRSLLEDVFRARGWCVLEARGRRQTMETLASHLIQVVIAEANFPGWPWKKLLRDLATLVHPPQLIVTSPHADDYLWSEALNLGAYDVLSQPLDRDETERVIASAHRRFEIEPLLDARRAARPLAGVA
jgi:DNA-binding NtrC family response regulator